MGKYEECVSVYELAGQYGVWEFVEKNYPETPWSYCEPCENDSPMEGSTCLVCGSEREAK